jgi:hypothetical protein
MTRFTCLMTVAAAALSTTLLAGTAMAEISSFTAGALTAGSSAAAFDVAIDVDGSKSTLPNLVYAVGKAPPAYSKTTPLATYSKTASLSGLTFAGTATKLSSTAKAVSTAGGGLTSSSDASIGTLSANLSVSPLGSLLKVTGSKVVSGARFVATTAGVRTPTGSASIGTLDIDGSKLGIGKLHFAGTPTPNHILYQNTAQTIVVTLNKQTITTAAGKATSITTDAVLVHIANYSLFGHTVSGDVAIAKSMAN